jgi:ribA/ribD-fused uncharacterized protein
VRTNPAALADPITSFTGQYRFLASPFPCQFWFEDIMYPSSEHAFQAAKTFSGSQRMRIAGQPDWREAKRMGRLLNLRPDWDRLRRAIMLQVVLAKFLQHRDLAAQLTATGDRVLIEGNWWGDTDWGAVKDNHPKWSPDLPWWHCGDTAWAGHNWLGITLMTVRDVLAPVTA